MPRVLVGGGYQERFLKRHQTAKKRISHCHMREQQQKHARTASCSAQAWLPGPKFLSLTACANWRAPLRALACFPSSLLAAPVTINTQISTQAKPQTPYMHFFLQHAHPERGASEVYPRVVELALQRRKRRVLVHDVGCVLLGRKCQRCRPVLSICKLGLERM